MTLGFGEIIHSVANNLTAVTGGAAGPAHDPAFRIHFLGRSTTQWARHPAAVLLPHPGFIVIAHDRLQLPQPLEVGRSWAAIREDETAADSLGINALKYKVMAFAIGASTAGFAGVFLASQNGTLFPTTSSIQVSITVVAS